MSKDLFIKPEELHIFGAGPSINPNAGNASMFDIVSVIAAKHGHALQRSFNPAHVLNSSFLDLYISGLGIASGSNMNLFISGMGTVVSSSMLNLFLCTFDNTAQLPLFISGEGTNAGYNYSRADLNLFLQRDTSNILDLMLAGPGVPVGATNLDLFIYGATISTGTLTLVVGAGSGTMTNNLPLYINGY